MKILALLPDDAFQTLARSLGSAHSLAHEREPGEVLDAVRAGHCDALVLDPALPDDEVFETLLVGLVRHHVPVLLFATLEARAAKRIVRAAETTTPELVLAGSGDTPLLLLRKLAALV